MQRLHTHIIKHNEQTYSINGSNHHTCTPQTQRIRNDIQSDDVAEIV